MIRPPRDCLISVVAHPLAVLIDVFHYAGAVLSVDKGYGRMENCDDSNIATVQAVMRSPYPTSSSSAQLPKTSNHRKIHGQDQAHHFFGTLL